MKDLRDMDVETEQAYATWMQKTGGYAKDMTLRDHYAGLALQGLIHHFDFGTFRDDPMRLAMWSLDAADAMLKERAK